MNIRQLIQWETKAAPAIHHEGQTITPQSQAITFRLPLPNPQAGIVYVWNRPVAVLVEEGGEVTRIPIYNLNRIMIFTLLGISMMVLLPLWFLSRLTR